MAVTLVLIPVVALAAYSATVTLRNVTATSYDMYPARTQLSVNYLAANSFLASSKGLDTKVTAGSVNKPHMLADDKLLFATSLPGNSSYPYQFTTHNALLDTIYIITGWLCHWTI